MMTDGNRIYHGDHFKMYRDIESLCCVPGTNIVLQVNYTSKNKQIHRKIKFVVMRGWIEGKLHDSDQKVQTPSSKVNNYSGCIHIKYN